MKLAESTNGESNLSFSTIALIGVLKLVESLEFWEAHISRFLTWSVILRLSGSPPIRSKWTSPKSKGLQTNSRMIHTKIATIFSTAVNSFDLKETSLKAFMESFSISFILSSQRLLSNYLFVLITCQLERPKKSLHTCKCLKHYDLNLSYVNTKGNHWCGHCAKLAICLCLGIKNTSRQKQVTAASEIMIL